MSACLSFSLSDLVVVLFLFACVLCCSICFSTGICMYIFVKLHVVSRFLYLSFFVSDKKNGLLIPVFLSLCGSV